MKTMKIIKTLKMTMMKTRKMKTLMMRMKTTKMSILLVAIKKMIL